MSGGLLLLGPAVHRIQTLRRRRSPSLQLHPIASFQIPATPRRPQVPKQSPSPTPTKTLKPDEVLPDLCFASHRSCVIRWPTSRISSSFFRRLTSGFYASLFQFRRYSEQDVETLAIGRDRTPARRPRCGVPRAYAGLDLGKGGGAE